DVSSDHYIGKVLGIAASGAYYKIFLYYLIVLLCLLTAFVTIRLRRLPIGRAWEALREEEIACRPRVINPTPQAYGVSDRREFPRVPGFLLCRPPGLRQPRILRLSRIGDRAVDRRAR